MISLLESRVLDACIDEDRMTELELRIARRADEIASQGKGLGRSDTELWMMAEAHVLSECERWDCRLAG